MYLKVELLPSHWVYFTTCHNWTHGEFFHRSPLANSWIFWTRSELIWKVSNFIGLLVWTSGGVAPDPGNRKEDSEIFRKYPYQRDTDPFKKHLTLSWCFFAHFLLSFHAVDGRDEIHWLHQFSISVFFVHFFSQGFCSTFHGANLFAKGKVYETFSLLRTGY